VALLEGRLLSSQLEQSEKFSNSPDWLEKSRPSKKATLLIVSCSKNVTLLCFIRLICRKWGLITTTWYI